MDRITGEQLEILRHTANAAAGGLFCGEGPDLDGLAELGLMELAGRKGFVPDPYWRLTDKGREAARFY